MAEVASPARMPMPMPGPTTPMAARPAPMYSMSGLPPRPGGARVLWDRRSVGGRGLRLPVHALLDGLDRALADVPLFVLVGLDGQGDEDEGQDTEDEGLHEVQHDLQAVEGDREQEGREEGQEDPEGHLATVDVAEESHRERDRLDELEHQLDEPDEQGDQPGTEAILELVDREELAQVATDAELAEALKLEEQEGHQGEADGDVDVARRGAQT